MNKKFTSVFLSFLICFCYLRELQVNAAVHEYHTSLRDASDSSSSSDSSDSAAEPTALAQIKEEQKVEIDSFGLGKACLGALMNTIPPDFCWRSIEGTPNVCPAGYSRVGIICHKNGSIFGFSMASCPVGSVKVLAFCHKDCDNAGLVSCGPLACASSTGACVSAIVNMVLQVAEGIITGIAFVLSFGASGPEAVALKTSVKVASEKAGDQAIKGIANNLRKKLTGQFGAKIKEGAFANLKTKISGLIKQGGQQIAQNLANVYAMNFCQPIFDSIMGKAASNTADVVGAQLVSAIDIFNIKGTYDACKDTSKDKGLSCAQNVITGLSIFDPTGLLTIAAAFMQPKCPDPIPTLTAQEKADLAAAAASGSQSSSGGATSTGPDTVGFSRDITTTTTWFSPDGIKAAVFQGDGNFVVYCNGNPIWASNTWNAGKKLSFQSDGNLVVYDGNNKATWASGTYGMTAAGAYMRIQDDGNLVIYDKNNAVKWATNKFCSVYDVILFTREFTPTRRWTSQDGQKVAVFQDDGNFVVYCGNRAIWASNTWHAGTKLISQGDGNLVIYDANGRATWATGTNGQSTDGLYLRMQNDGNLVMYGKNNSVKWATNKFC